MSGGVGDGLFTNFVISGDACAQAPLFDFGFAEGEASVG